MRLEQEIHQKAFRNQYHKLAVNILHTHGWLAGKHTDTLKKHGITIAQYNILRILRGQHPGPATIALLRERMLDKMSDASRLVDRLEQKQLVERRPCSEDRRKTYVVITGRGLDMLAELDTMELQFDSVFAAISEEDAAIANDVLDRLRG